MENMEMNLIKPLDDCQGRTVNIPEGMFNWIAEKAIQSVFFFLTSVTWGSDGDWQHTGGHWHVVVERLQPT